MDKWLDGLDEKEVVVVNVRPDCYVGTVRRFVDGTKENGMAAVQWMDQYYEQFLKDT